MLFWQLFKSWGIQNKREDRWNIYKLSRCEADERFLILFLIRDAKRNKINCQINNSNFPIETTYGWSHLLKLLVSQFCCWNIFFPIIYFTNTSNIKLWVVSMEHLQRLWLASRERLTFRTPGSVNLFGTCLCSNCWDQIPRTCHVFTRLFTLNAPWYFLDFA